MYIDKKLEYFCQIWVCCCNLSNCLNLSICQIVKLTQIVKFELLQLFGISHSLFSIAKAAYPLCQLPTFIVVFLKKFVSLNSVTFLEFRIL